MKYKEAEILVGDKLMREKYIRSQDLAISIARDYLQNF
jgi:hypothetical protein